MVCRGSRPLLLPSSKYKEWHVDASNQITQQKIQPVKGCIESVTLTFYAPDKRKFDLTNKAESIMDLLVDNGIIEDDNYSVIPNLQLKFGGVEKENPRVEISLSPSVD